MSIATVQAERVLKKSLYLNPDPEVEAQVSTFGGKRYSHWSIFATLGVSLVGAIAAVAGVILSQPFLMASGIALGVSNALASFYLWKFVPLKALEGMTKVLSNRINNLGGVIQDLRDVNKDLESFDGNMRELVEKQQESHRLLQEKYDRKIEEFQKLNGLLAEKTQELEGTRALYDQMQNLIAEFDGQAESFNTQHLALDGSLDNLRKEIENSSGLEARIRENTKDLAAQNSLFADHVEDLTDFAQDLHSQLAILHKVHDQLKEERDQLKMRVEELECAQEKALKEAEALQKASEGLQDVVENVDNTTKELEKTNEAFRLAPSLEKLLKKIDQSSVSLSSAAPLA